MKNIIIILLSLLTISSYGQNELEIKIFKYFNDYRVENGVNPLKFDYKVFLAAQHHNNYLNDNGYPYNYNFYNGHREKELVYVSDRVKEYGTTTLLSSGECIAYVFRAIKQSDESLLMDVIKLWDKSPTHKEIMLLDNIDVGGISVLQLVDSKGDYFLVTLNVVNISD